MVWHYAELMGRSNTCCVMCRLVPLNVRHFFTFCCLAVLSELLQAKWEYVDIVLLLPTRHAYLVHGLLMFHISKDLLIVLMSFTKAYSTQCALCHKKVKFTLQLPESTEGVEILPYSVFSLGARWGWVVNATSQLIYPREWPSTHCVGGGVGPWGQSGQVQKMLPH